MTRRSIPDHLHHQMAHLSFLRIAILLGTISWCFPLAAQTKQEQAWELAREAIRLMDKGEVDRSIDLLKQAQKMDPKNNDIPYEIAYAHYLKKEYRTSIKLLEGLSKKADASDQVFQMLGNSYSMNGEREKAIATYEKGLLQFPSSGILHLERGNMELFVERYDAALGYYEKGIAVAPAFPSNYYWAAKLFLASDNPMWGLQYGEILMNLERNSARTAEISALLHRTYTERILLKGDTGASISLCKNMVMAMPTSGSDRMRLPYCMIYEPTLLLATVGETTIDMGSLDRIRTRFLRTYLEQGHQGTHPNALLAYQDRVQKAGHIEAYNHWILMKGDEEAFARWNDADPDRWKAFVTWFSDNPMKPTPTDRFHRDQF